MAVQVMTLRVNSCVGTNSTIFYEKLRGISSVRKWLKEENSGLWKFLVIKFHDFISRYFFF
jgi:hypothetical protein